MRLLSLSSWKDLSEITAYLEPQPHEIVRGPETGLVMIRGRMGSTGSPFNLGEATVTRCTIRLPEGTEGHAYVLGRNGEHAKRAALCDALLQRQEAQHHLQSAVIAPLRQRLDQTRETTARKAAATKVDFFTLVRGDV